LNKVIAHIDAMSSQSRTPSSTTAKR